MRRADRTIYKEGLTMWFHKFSLKLFWRLFTGCLILVILAAIMAAGK